ncbi:MAG: hypothetical protein Q9185_005430 [Variospora sp. 1 TL-2023]
MFAHLQNVTSHHHPRPQLPHGLPTYQPPNISRLHASYVVQVRHRSLLPYSPRILRVFHQPRYTIHRHQPVDLSPEHHHLLSKLPKRNVVLKPGQSSSRRAYHAGQRDLHPQHTKSGNPSQSTSPSKAGRKQSTSSSKAGRKQSTSTKTSVVSETASAPGLLKAETRSHLGQMTPPVTFHIPDCLKGADIPAPVHEFWLKYIVPAIDATEVVPRERYVSITRSDSVSPTEPSAGAIRNHVQHAHEIKTQIPTSAYAEGLYDAADLDKVMETVDEVLIAAQEHRSVCHEPQWGIKVLEPLLSRVVKLAPFRAGGAPRMEDLNVSVLSHRCWATP